MKIQKIKIKITKDGYRTTIIRVLEILREGIGP